MIPRKFVMTMNDFRNQELRCSITFESAGPFWHLWTPEDHTILFTSEAEFKAAFGDHLLIGRKYLIEHGLEINGLEETEEDRERTVKGNISLQLRNPEIDNTHLNEAGYIALAQGVYEKGKELGYW